MKTKLFSIAIILTLLVACENQGSNDLEAHLSTDIVDIADEDRPVMEFKKVLHDFGEITQGEKVNYSFTFKNTGKTDLIITSARGSCGCTVPKWPKRPIAPGQESVIDVLFDSHNKKGNQHKKVTVVANTMPATNVIAFKGMVIAPKSELETNNEIN